MSTSRRATSAVLVYLHNDALKKREIVPLSKNNAMTTHAVHKV